MTKIILLFQNVWKQIIYNKFLNIVMLITMAIGLFFPLMALNDVNDLLADGHITADVDTSRVAVIDYLMAYKDEEEMYAIIDSGREKGLFNNAGFCALERQIIYAGEESYSGGVSGISREYLELNAYELLDGELLTEKDYAEGGDKVCLLGHQNILVRNGIKIGDTIQILGDTYKIKGIIRAPRIYGSVLIPYAMTPELFSGSNSQIQFQIVTYGEKEPTPRILSFKLFLGEYCISAQTGAKQEEIYYESIREVNRYRILRATLVIGFAIINLFLLLLGRIIRERYNMAIRMALGASKLTVGAEVVVENLCLMFIAFFIDILLYSRVSGLVNGSNTYLQPITILQVCIGGLLMIIITSSISYYIILRKQGIALLLKKQ